VDHLFASRVKVQRLQLTVESGRTAEHDWIDQAGLLANFPCRLDLLFVRPGKDAQPAYEAGVARDRIGLMFCSAKIPLLAGDRIVTISGPIQGTFEIRNIPDRAQDFGTAHHIEVQIVETNQTLTGPTTFPSSDALPEPTPPLEP
jgi:hypothetical protein